jgi:hypothetical protein
VPNKFSDFALIAKKERVICEEETAIYVNANIELSLSAFVFLMQIFVQMP